LDLASPVWLPQGWRPLGQPLGSLDNLVLDWVQLKALSMMELLTNYEASTTYFKAFRWNALTLLKWVQSQEEKFIKNGSLVSVIRLKEDDRK